MANSERGWLMLHPYVLRSKNTHEANISLFVGRKEKQAARLHMPAE
jgi:hypothetical protein